MASEYHVFGLRKREIVRGRDERESVKEKKKSGESTGTQNTMCVCVRVCHFSVP